MSRQAAVALILLLGCACISTNQMVRPGGDTARITMRDRTCCKAELLALTPVDLYYLRDLRVCCAPLADIISVHIEGYSLRTWKYVTLGVVGAADAVLGVCAANMCSLPFGFVPVPFLIGGAWWALRDEPRVEFRAPLTDSAIAQLAIYCRYPRSLADAQWQELLRFYHQDTFLSFSDSPKP
jgi:hypothetical protein